MNDRIIQFLQNEANNDIFLNISVDYEGGKIIAMDEDFIPIFEFKIRDLSNAEFQKVFEALKQYIRNNPQQFEMGELIHENAN